MVGTFVRIAPTMAVMPTSARSEDVRVAILKALRRRELAGHEGPTWDELAQETGVDAKTVRYHTQTLSRLCLVARRHYEHRSLALTEAGRLAADCLLTSDA